MPIRRRLPVCPTCYLPTFMASITLVVIGDPAAPHMSLLKDLPPEVHIIISHDPAELEQQVPRCDVLLNAAFHGRLFRQMFPLAGKARWAHNLSTGVENVLTPEVMASSLPLTNGRGVFSDILAEFVAGSILYFAKDFARMARNQQAGRWEQFDVLAVKGATLAIVGYGDIGRASARLAVGLGMKVVAMRRQNVAAPHDSLLAAIYPRDRMNDMLATADYLLISAPLTPETRGMIDANALNALKTDAVLINVGRGPIVVEAALVRALEQGRLKGAALDVFDEEPLPPGHPFYMLKNVLLSPHCADHLSGWESMAMMKFLENFWRFWNDEPLENIVNKHAGY